MKERQKNSNKKFLEFIKNDQRNLKRCHTNDFFLEESPVNVEFLEDVELLIFPLPSPFNILKIIELLKMPN